MEIKTIPFWIATFLPLLFGQPFLAQKKIVVLGSSTAAGSGASSYANAWVGQYTAYATALNAGNAVINLAVGGYNTYLIVPTGTPHPGRPDPDTLRNVSAAIKNYRADVVIVNMPSNDVANSYDVSEVLLNYRRIKRYCDSAGVPVYFTTTQPRNFTDVGKLGQLMEIRDSTHAQYGSFAIDFWTTVASADGTINPSYNAGDGVHINDAGHTLFFDRVKAKPVFGVTALPVAFSDFTAVRAGGTVQLEWKVTSAGALWQEIQRSANGAGFVALGTATASGNARFSFRDTHPADGDNFYRVRLQSTGAEKYSPVLRVSAPAGVRGFSIYPNPATSRVLSVQLHQPLGNAGTLRLVNAAGSQVWQQPVADPSAASFVLALPAHLPAGVYWLVLLSSGNHGQQQILLP